MSLSNPQTNQNPATKFIDWKGSEGYFKYYNKETKEDIRLESPLYIIVLDQLSTITGYSDEMQSGIWSNEVRLTAKEEFFVKTKQGVQAKGLYQTIKPQIVQMGGKYAKSVYAVLISGDKENTKLDLVNFKFYGSSLSPFIEAKIGDTGEVILLEQNPEIKKKGATKYYEPKITKLQKREDILEKAINLDKELQEYLQAYFSKEIDGGEIIQQSIPQPIAKASLEMPEINMDEITVQMPF
jgi:hypothetical protein